MSYPLNTMLANTDFDDAAVQIIQRVQNSHLVFYHCSKAIKVIQCDQK